MFLEQLSDMLWSLIDLTDNVEVKSDLSEQMYISVLKEHAPVIIKRVKMLSNLPALMPTWLNL